MQVGGEGVCPRPTIHTYAHACSDTHESMPAHTHMHTYTCTHTIGRELHWVGSKIPKKCGVSCKCAELKKDRSHRAGRRSEHAGQPVSRNCMTRGPNRKLTRASMIHAACCADRLRPTVQAGMRNRRLFLPLRHKPWLLTCPGRAHVQAAWEVARSLTASKEGPQSTQRRGVRTGPQSCARTCTAAGWWAAAAQPPGPRGIPEADPLCPPHRFQVYS